MPEPTQWRPLLRTGDSGSRNDAARRLWSLWRQGHQPEVDEFLKQTAVVDPDQVLAVVRVDQAERFRLGQSVLVETYLNTFAPLRENREQAVDLIFAEYLLREEAGEHPAPGEYLRRFPQYANELKLQLELHQAIETQHQPPEDWPAGTEPTCGRGEPDPGALSAQLPTIPGYEILGVLGRGGMGVVYRAWQKGLNRLVAVKMIHAGAQASPAILARFHVEAVAVARLQHPNIVQVHDVGEHAGSPFLVLELIEGRSLAQRVAGTPQPARWAAELVETLARAISAAHQQGVVHRDLTPANILLTAQGVPKITDFGLAKLIIGGGDLRTQTGELLGTPSYMAPEQAASLHHAIGVATDVYALGAILYELIAGRPPFKAGSPLETLRQVVSNEPVALSRLVPSVPRDLETICLKCLRKEPAKRYADALDLAQDLRRYRDSRPILARRIGPLERAWRWGRRNPAMAALSALVVALTIALAVGSTTAALWLKGSRDEARRQRNRAEQNFREARQAVDDSFTRVSESTLLHTPGLQPLRKQLLQDALRYYQGFVHRLADQPGVQDELAAALDRLARITSEIGSKEEALEYLRQERAIYQRLASSRPSDARRRRELARSIAAIALLRAETGRRVEALSDYDEALAIQRALVSADPHGVQAHDDLATSESGLGQVLVLLGRRDEALNCFERALALRERLTAAFPDASELANELALDHARIGRMNRDAHHDDEAIRSCRRALAIQQRLVAAHPEVARYRSDLANTYRFLGLCQRGLNRLDEALESYQKARESQEALAADNPSVTEYRYDLAATFNSIANIQGATGRREEALLTHRRALGIREKLVAANPRIVRFLDSMAGTYNAIGINQGELGRLEDALRTFQQLQTRMQAVLEDEPANIDARAWLASAWHNIGDALLALGRPADAVPAFQQAIEQKRRVLEERPASKIHLRSLGNHYLDFAQAKLALGQPAVAAATLWEHREIWDNDPEGLYKLACGLAQCVPIVAKGQAQPTPEQRAQRQEYADRAMDALRRAVAAGFHDLAHIAKDASLGPLRTRDDFGALVGDLDFPDDPFAPSK
jgi:tetratricopeptide (TPR) repeat protein